MRTFYLHSDPLESRFARTLQAGLREVVKENVLRSRRGGHINCTPRTLNKLNQLQLFKARGVSCPEFTTDPAEVQNFDSELVFARTVLNGSSGAGIVEFNRVDQPPTAPLYTAYVKKSHEYRVHVMAGEVIDVQEKRRRDGNPPSRIRNLDNGYVFCHDNVNATDALKQIALDAVNSLNYPHGAVDIIYNTHYNRYYALEVNSRPGLEGKTLTAYVAKIVQMYNLTLKDLA